jgi:phosphoheptose isomerase
MPFPAIDLTQVRTYPIAERRNLVTRDKLVRPGDPLPPFQSADFDAVVERTIRARGAGRQVLWMIGAHVVKSGLSPLLIDLLERGIVTHLATNGAGAIHDFEIALIGETSEDVAQSIEDGSFGMAEETGALMNRAVRAGARDGLGFGEALGRFVHEQSLPYRQDSLLYHAYRLGVPLTVHVAIGTDIIHQHPTVDFGALGWASGQDFRIYCHTVSRLEGGVFCNLGSAVIGPEVFLKALSIARNLGHMVSHITTANFDLIPLSEDYRSPLGHDDPTYYYRPRKNIVNRPTSLGGKGFHVTGDHRATLPNLHARLVAALGDGLAGARVVRTDFERSRADERAARPLVLEALVARRPELAGAAGQIERAFWAIARSQEHGGSLFICGNGGSMADALHLSGELLKSYNRPRPLTGRQRARLAAQPGGGALAANLERGLRVVVLGVNPSLSSAVDNDNPERGMIFAQELVALARPGDVWLGISTSGRAQSVRYAASVAAALGLTTIALTGADGSPLVDQVDLPIRAPGERTDRVQEWHVLIYHALAEMLEQHFFAEG